MPGPGLLHPQPGQQLQKVASPRSVALGIEIPHMDGHFKLFGDDIENRTVRPFVTRKHSSGITKVAHQYSDAEAVVLPAVLPDERQIRFRQRVQPNQLSLICREGEQFKAF